MGLKASQFSFSTIYNTSCGFPYASPSPICLPAGLSDIGGIQCAAGHIPVISISSMKQKQYRASSDFISPKNICIEVYYTTACHPSSFPPHDGVPTRLSRMLLYRRLHRSKHSGSIPPRLETEIGWKSFNSVSRSSHELTIVFQAKPRPYMCR